MSNKSGISSQVLSLPSGGGAMKGIGETFSADLFSGTGHFSVPIELPAGRNCSVVLRCDNLRRIGPRWVLAVLKRFPVRGRN